ncbi:MAG TPA: hypothetical protein VLX92_10590 [Kofleriaceae bacterium]|nr:hypothetical protein [Kofleriaceae bacterium]
MRIAILGGAMCALFACSSPSKPGGGDHPDGGSGNSAGDGGGSAVQPSSCAAMATGAGASLGGITPFPSDNAWNTDISSAPVDPNSDTLIGFIGSTAPFHPDFGSSGGIPYVVVDSTTTPLVDVALDDDSESDSMPMPFTADAPIEDGGDAHVLVIDRATCWLYEVYSASYSGSWSAANSAVWDLESYNDRPLTWTSADAAGLPILPGLVRFDEVSAGAIHHALRMTVPQTVAAFLPPATHWAQNDASSPIPMGLRLRLKASVDISSYSAADKVILTAMKTYGLIVADNGSAMYVTGAPDSRWNDDDLHKLTALHASDFEVVAMGTEITKSNMPSGQKPAIASLQASQSTVAAGTAVTLTWSSTGASYEFIQPSAGDEVGTVRGTSVTVHPQTTTSYTLVSTNSFGRVTQKVTVTVP